MKNKDQFSQAELDHARDYMNDVLHANGMEPMKMDHMEDGDLYKDGSGKAKDENVTNDPAVITQRKQTAFDFYKKHDPSLLDQEIYKHMQGIDYSKPVEVVKIPPDGLGPKGNELYQFTKVNSKGKVLKGQYYSDNPAHTPGDLGVSDKYNVRDENWKYTDEVKTVKQEKIVFDEAKPVEGLKSSSAKINDTWSLDNNPVSTERGGSQIYIPKNQ